jgi:plasmid replication initiation protein
MIMQVIYTWDDGREEVRYERPADSEDAAKFRAEVEKLHQYAKEGSYVSPYSIRYMEQA